MQKLKKAHIYYPLLGILLISYTLGGVVWAINTVTEGWAAQLNVLTRIDVRANYGDCKDVTVQAIGGAFVPTRTVGEWDRFKGYKPSTIRVAACGYNQCTAAGQLYDTVKVGGNACNFNDRIVCTGNGEGYTWSMCNVGTNSAGDYGTLYQWGRDGAPFTYNGYAATGGEPPMVAGPQAPGYSVGTFITRPGGSDGNWRNPADANDYGGNGTSGNVGTYITQGRPAAMNGPCPAGYHVPTAKEWCDTLVAAGVGAGLCLASPPYLEAGASNTVSHSWIRSVLALPSPGTRANKTAINYSAGVDSSYWTSTPAATNRSIMVYVGTTANTVGYYNDDRADAFSIRCIRND